LREQEKIVFDIEHNISELEASIQAEESLKNELEIEIATVEMRITNISEESVNLTAKTKILLENEEQLSNQKKILLESNHRYSKIIEEKDPYKNQCVTLQNCLEDIIEKNNLALSRITDISQEILHEKELATKKLIFTPSNEMIVEIEREVDERYAQWENQELEAHCKTLSELQNQLSQLQSGCSHIFPDLFLSRSHELAKLRGILTTLKHGREGKGLATLVSHLHQKINSAAVVELEPPSKIECHPCPDLILSPLAPKGHPAKSRKTSPPRSLSSNAIEVSSIDRPARSSKKLRESKVLQSSTCLDSRSEHHATGGARVTQQKKAASNTGGRSSLSWASKQQSAQKKKIPFVANDWLFDDTDLSTLR